MAMSTGVDDESPEARGLISATKVIGWVAGLIMAIFGALMCAAPAGLILGVPLAVLGILLCLSFAVSMATTTLSTRTVLPMATVGLALMVLGRRLTPLAALADSLKSFGAGAGAAGRGTPVAPVAALGLPLLLAGTLLFGTVVVWFRDIEGRYALRRRLGLALVQLGTAGLFAGAVLTTGAGTPIDRQPLWLWAAAPVAVALGVGLRAGFNHPRWLAVLALTAATLPLAWLLSP
jgi:hypothetical protein